MLHLLGLMVWLRNNVNKEAGEADFYGTFHQALYVHNKSNISYKIVTNKNKDTRLKKKKKKTCTDIGVKVNHEISHTCLNRCVRDTLKKPKSRGTMGLARGVRVRKI